MALLLLNLSASVAPLVFSSGSVLYIASIYKRNCSSAAAWWSIVAWCICEASTGLSLLLFLHALQRNDSEVNLTATYFAVPLLFVTWLVVCYALHRRRHGIAVISSLANFCAHVVVAGLTLAESGYIAALFAFVGVLWISWTACFSFSMFLFVRRRIMQTVGDYVMRKMQNDAPQFQRRRTPKKRSN